jgi:hypothetical protein
MMVINETRREYLIRYRTEDVQLMYAREFLPFIVFLR